MLSKIGVMLVKIGNAKVKNSYWKIIFVFDLFLINCRLKDKLKWILDATRQHSTNLAKFVFIYKSLNYLFSWSEGKIREFHSPMSAFIGGYVVFGKRTSVNEQVS